MDRDDTAAPPRPPARARPHHPLRHRRRLRRQARPLAAAPPRPRRPQDRPPGPHDLHPPRVHGRHHQAPPLAHRRPRSAATPQGRLTALDLEGVFDTGAYASWGPTVANRVPVHATGPYRVPHVLARARAIHTHGPVSGAFRGFGVPQAAIASEALIDRLADAAGLDRLEFRALNALRDGDATATGQILHGVGIADCLDALRPPWHARPRRRGRGQRRPGPAAAASASPAAGTAAATPRCPTPRPSASASAPTAPSSSTRAPSTSARARTPSSPRSPPTPSASRSPPSPFSAPTPRLTPDAGKSSASRQTYISGNAAAARRPRAPRRDPAPRQRRPRRPPRARRPPPRRRRRPRHRPRRASPPTPHGYVFAAEERYDPPTTPLDADGQGVPYAVYGYGAQIVELAVDTALGTVELLKITAAHDVGRAINPTLAEGQIEGGIAQGIGMALMEEYLPGRTENLHDYLIPTIGDVPEIERHPHREARPRGPVRRQGPRRARADPDRARDPQRHPPRHRRRDHPPPRPPPRRPRRDPRRRPAMTAAIFLAQILPPEAPAGTAGPRAA